jgi:hypothetical protein
MVMYSDSSIRVGSLLGDHALALKHLLRIEHLPRWAIDRPDIHLWYIYRHDCHDIFLALSTWYCRVPFKSLTAVLGHEVFFFVPPLATFRPSLDFRG